MQGDNKGDKKTRAGNIPLTKNIIYQPKNGIKAIHPDSLTPEL